MLLDFFSPKREKKPCTFRFIYNKVVSDCKLTAVEKSNKQESDLLNKTKNIFLLE